MRTRIRLVIGFFSSAFLLCGSVSFAQTATPTPTPTITPTPTPTASLTTSTELLAIVINDGTGDGCWQYSGYYQQLDVRNIGSNSITLKLSPGISEISPITPTATDGEYILPAGVQLRLPYGKKLVCYRAGSSATTSLSIEVVPQSERP